MSAEDEAEGHLRRRSDDCVSYREMVEYVAEAVAQFHSIRAESLMRVSNELEKIEAQFGAHQEWHRTLLEKMLAQSKQSTLAIMSLVIGALGVLVAIVAVVVTRH